MGQQKMEKPVLLVVENEAVILMNVVQVAQDAGFEVLETANADEAIEILESRTDIGVVFTAVRTRGSMSGLRLANIIKDRWPAIRLIVTSGIDVSNHPDFPIRGWFIQKPYENGRIAAALQEVLNAE
jgi:two-component system, response regulator PdtaR